MLDAMSTNALYKCFRHICSLPWTHSSRFMSFLCWNSRAGGGTPELDVVLQVKSHEDGEEGKNHLPWPAGDVFFDATQGTVLIYRGKSVEWNCVYEGFNKLLMPATIILLVFWAQCQLGEDFR